MKKLLKSTGFILYFFIAQIISCTGILFVKAFTDYKWFENLLLMYEQGNMTEYMKLFSELIYPALIMSDFIVVVPMILYSVKKKIKIADKISTRSFINIFTLGIAMNFITSAIITFMPASFTNKYNELMNVALNRSTNFGMILLITGILTPVAEEFIFRFEIINIFKDKGEKFAVIISALLFGLAHLNPIQSTYAFVMGIILGYLYVSEKNMIKNILFHVAVNASSVIFEYSPELLQKFELIFAVVCTVYIVMKCLDKKKVRAIV